MFPFQGVSMGLLCGFLFGVWLAIGYMFTDKNWDPFPSPSQNCTAPFIGNGTAYTSAFSMEEIASSAATTTEKILGDDNV